MSQATCYKTVAAWNMTYQQFEGFPHPNPYVGCGKRPLPTLLEVFPDAKDQIVPYAIKNLVKLTIKGVHNFFVSKVIPRLMKLLKSDTSLSSTTTSIAATGNHTQHATTSTTTNEGITDVDPVRSFLATYQLGSLSLTTAWRSMRLLGFHYVTREKSFYVEGHEREDVVANCNKFCQDYLTECETYCCQRVQLSLEYTSTINGLDLQFGYHYENIIAGTSYIEFHVNYWNRFSATTEAAD
jgi:hypothetical protein